MSTQEQNTSDKVLRVNDKGRLEINNPKKPTQDQVLMVIELFELMRSLEGHSASYVRAKEVFKHFNITRVK